MSALASLTDTPRGLLGSQRAFAATPALSLERWRPLPTRLLHASGVILEVPDPDGHEHRATRCPSASGSHASASRFVDGLLLRQLLPWEPIHLDSRIW